MVVAEANATPASKQLYQRSCSLRLSRNASPLGALTLPLDGSHMQQAALAYACDIGHPGLVSAMPMPLFRLRSDDGPIELLRGKVMDNWLHRRLGASPSLDSTASVL